MPDFDEYQPDYIDEEDFHFDDDLFDEENYAEYLDTDYDFDKFLDYKYDPTEDTDGQW